MNYTITILFLVIFSFGMAGCDKEFLEKKPDKSQIVPETIADLQSLLDNYSFVELTSGSELVEIAADDFFRFQKDMGTLLTIVAQNTYTWEKDMYGGTDQIKAWNSPYQSIFYCNVVLEGLEKISPLPAEQAAYNNARSTALFYRGYAMYNLLQNFSPAYSSTAATSALGVPVRTSADVNELVPRSTQKESYEFMIRQFEMSLPTLPDRVTTPNRPCKAGAYATLSRIYLSMDNYEQAEYYAGLSLQATSTLLDYNTLDANLARPFPLGESGANPEILQFSYSGGLSWLSGTTTYVDSNVYKLYHPDDRRKVCFFRARNGYYNFKGTYSGNTSANGGPCTDEIYLIKAECLARRNQTKSAMDTLNALLKKRYITNAFTPLVAASAEEALQTILLERRKELIGRSLRWYDLRRLNKDPHFAVTLRKIKNGNIVELPPGDLRYTFPIPDQEIQKSGIVQNPR